MAIPEQQTARSRRRLLFYLALILLLLSPALLLLQLLSAASPLHFPVPTSLPAALPSASSSLSPPASRTPPAPIVLRRLPDPSSPDAAVWSARHVLFFLHVPKTAGQSFTALLRSLTSPYQQLLARTGLLVPPRLDLTFMARPHTLRLVSPSARRLFGDAFSRFVLAVGHCDVMIAEAFQHREREVEFVTLLRRPEQRLLSLYCFIVAEHSTVQTLQRRSRSSAFPSWLAYAQSSSDVLSTASFRQFVLLQARDGLDNWQTRAYAGCLHTPVMPQSAQPRLCSAQQPMLAEAKRRLTDFLFFGLHEQYEQSERLLRYALRRPQPQPQEAAVRVNINAGKERCMAIVTADGALRLQLDAEVRQAERLDAELYEHAAELFSARLKALPEEA